MVTNFFKTKVSLILAGVLFLSFVTCGILYVSFGGGVLELLQLNQLDGKLFSGFIFIICAVCVCLIIFCDDKKVRYALLIIALYYVLVYLILAFYRIQYPFELEWEEGSSVDHVVRILSGQKLYVKPSLAFIPYIYTPFYFYLSAGVSKFFSVGFLPLRLVSFTSSLGCLFVIFSIVRRETGNILWGVLSACLFAATFRLSGAWFDVARVDSLFLFLLLLAVYVVRFYSSVPSCILAGFLISLSFYTKQIAFIPAILLMVYVLIAKRNQVFYFMTTVFVLIGGGVSFLNKIHQGYFNYYVFYLPMHHELVNKMLVYFWTRDIFLPLFIACGLGIFYLIYSSTFLDRNISRMYMLITIAMMLSSWGSRLHGGGYDNVLFSAYAIIAILFGLGAHSLEEVINATFINGRGLILKILYSLCILQFAFLFYNPVKQVPTSQDLQAGKKLLEMIRGIKGDVYIPFHGYLGILAGKKSYAHEMARYDILRVNRGLDRDKESLENEIEGALRQHRFSAIILDRKDWYEIDKYYHQGRWVFENGRVFLPVTGFQTRPSIIFLPNGRLSPDDK